MRGEAAAGAGAGGARPPARGGRGGSAQQPCQPHAEPRGRSRSPARQVTAPRGSRAVREGRGEPRGRGVCQRLSPPRPPPLLPEPGPRRRWAGSREGGRRRGARGGCLGAKVWSRRLGAEPRERWSGGRNLLGAPGGHATGWAPPQCGAGPSRRPKSLRGPRHSGSLSRVGNVALPLPTLFCNRSYLPAPSASSKHWDGPALCFQIPQCPAASAFQKLSSVMQAPHLQVKKLRPRELHELTLVKQWCINTNGEH